MNVNKYSHVKGKFLNINWWAFTLLHIYMLPLVTYTSEYYQYVCPHVDPHLSPPTAQQWVSMCIRPICINVDHLEVFSRDRTRIVNVPEGFLCNFNEGPSPVMYGHILDSH